MEKKGKFTRKKEVLITEPAISHNKRTKQSTNMKNCSLAKQKILPKDEHKTKVQRKRSQSVGVTIISSNRYLGSLVTQINKKLLKHISLRQKENRQEARRSLQISLETNGSKRMIFNFNTKTKGKFINSIKHEEEAAELVKKEFDQLRWKANNAIFVFYTDFVEEVDKTCCKILCNLNLSYQPSFFNEILTDLKNGISTYKQKKKADIAMLFNDFQEFRTMVDKFPRYPLQTRKFVEIDKYESALNDRTDIKNFYDSDKILKSDLKPSCGDACECGDNRKSLAEYSELGKFRDTWKCGCIDKKNNIECDDGCGCGKDCKNRMIDKYDDKQLKERVDVKLCWGADLFTRKNLCCLMPSYLTFTQQSYLADKVVSCLNEFGYEGWNITNALQLLVKRTKKLLKERKDKQREDNKNTVNMLSLNNLAAYGCEMVIEQEKDEELLTLEEELTVYITLEKNSRISQVRGALRLHSKGLGVVCAKPEGISKNDLVVKYIGEVYPPWYWCIKQDVIKSFLLMVKKGRLKNLAQYKNNFNIDFYNIMLEKHPKEPKGRDIVIVDPIIRGNFASRLSHSCDPNCVALPVISNGQYSIAMYALREIKHGEELTFDYCSFTESETEFKNSVCLCGTLLCKGHYLGYTKKHVHFFSGEAKKYLLDNTNSFFLRNNAAVLKACLSSFNKEKEEFLLKNGLGDNTFKDAPNWLKNWAYNVLKTILMERETLYRELLGFEFADIGQSSNMMSPQQIQIKFETDSLFFQRINNLIISIDKMGFFIRKQSQTQKKEKPLRLLKPKEYVSMIKRVMQQLKDHISSKLPVNIQKLIDCYLDQAKSFKSNQLFQKMKTLCEPISNIDVLKVIEGKHIMLLISDFLQKTEKPQLKAMGDIIYLMAFTVAYFFGHTYDSFSINIAVRECDLTSSKRALLHNSQSEEEQIAKLISPIITLPK